MFDIPWEIIENFTNVNDMVQVWNSLFHEIVNKYAPIKQHRVKKSRPPDWLNPDILDTIKERNKCKINGYIEDYKQLRNKVSTMIKSAKQSMYKTKLEEGTDNPSSIWKLFRKLGAGKKSKSKENILGINVDNEFVSSDVEIADTFNKYVANVASKLKEPIHDSNFEYIKKFVDSKVDNNVSFSIPEINIAFVRKCILNLDILKSTGLVDIGPRILKVSYDIISQSITFLINNSLSLGIFPNVWETANIIPIHKTGPNEDVNNYRPISILPTVSKIIEKWIHLNFMKYLNDNKLLHEKQSGFRAGHSTESALILLIDSWLKAINEGKFVGCVMIDFRKAFDLVDHAVLLKKLEIYKCGKSA